MKRKRMKKVITMCTLAASIFAIGATLKVQAKNNADTYWAFNKLGDGIYDNNLSSFCTPCREKQDTSKVYFYPTKLTNKKSNDYMQVWVVDPNFRNFDRYWVRTISSTGQYSITNWAYEQYNAPIGCRVRAYAPYRSNYTWYACGWWSPDSSRTYN